MPSVGNMIQVSPGEARHKAKGLLHELAEQLHIHGAEVPHLAPESAGKRFVHYGEQLAAYHRLLYERGGRRIRVLSQATDAAIQQVDVVQQADEDNARTVGGVM